MVLTILAAGASMFVADCLLTLLTQAQARNRAVLSGVLDTLAWGAGIVVTLTALDSLNGHNVPLMVGVVAAVSISNFAGTLVGVRLGKRFVPEDPTTALVQRIESLERARHMTVPGATVYHRFTTPLSSKEE